MKNGWECPSNDRADTDSEEVQRISLSRTKRNIRELALCNDFEYFATLTINSKYADRFHLDEVQDKLKKINKKIVRKNKNFKYLYITERHKDGAFHFHGLVRGIELYINNNGYFSNKDYDELGFNSFSKINDYSKCCNYITKYITKDCVRNTANQVYISSRGLKKALKTDCRAFDDDFYNFSNDFCKIRDFRLEDLSEQEKLKILYNLEGK